MQQCSGRSWSRRWVLHEPMLRHSMQIYYPLVRSPVRFPARLVMPSREIFDRHSDREENQKICVAFVFGRTAFSTACPSLYIPSMYDRLLED